MYDDHDVLKLKFHQQGHNKKFGTEEAQRLNWASYT